MDTADSPPDINDPGWNEWADDQLSDVEFDTDLGREMGEDALRVAEGELSKAEFHERYSDAVEAEFGVDERPTKEAVDSPATLPKVPNEREETRRNVLRALGGAAAAGVAGVAGCLDSSGAASTAQTGGVADADDGGVTDDVDHQKQIGMVIDTERCIACLQCSEACKEENNTDIGVHWPYVFRYEDEHAGEMKEDFLTRHCQHCSEASCTYVCPTQARYKRKEDGIVLTDYDTCVGCKYCQVACPYGVNYLGKDNPNPNIETFDPDDGEAADDGDEFWADREVDGRTVAGSPPRGVMGKCTFCIHRQDLDEDHELHGTTACEQRCPVDAIHFGDMNDGDSDPRQHLREKVESNQYRLLPEVGNEPNIVYVGREPSKDATPVQGPTAYESRDMKDGNYEFVLNGGDEE